MNRYKILSEILLSFQGRWGSVDCLIGPREYIDLECDGSTIWAIRVVPDGKREESITQANAISIWVSQQKIKQI